jgi:hypothetical protein
MELISITEAIRGLAKTQEFVSWAARTGTDYVSRKRAGIYASAEALEAFLAQLPGKPPIDPANPAVAFLHRAGAPLPVADEIRQLLPKLSDDPTIRRLLLVATAGMLKRGEKAVHIKVRRLASDISRGASA